MEIKIGNTCIELQEGTMMRYADGTKEYFDVGIDSHANRILFDYCDANSPGSYIEEIISKFSDEALSYIENIINNNKNILIRCWYVSGYENSSFAIYYNCDCKDSDLMSLIAWMINHTDLDGELYKFMSIDNGKVKQIEF